MRSSRVSEVSTLIVPVVAFHLGRERDRMDDRNARMVAARYREENREVGRSSGKRPRQIRKASVWAAPSEKTTFRRTADACTKENSRVCLSIIFSGAFDAALVCR